MRTTALIARTALVLALPLVLAGCPDAGGGGGGGGYRVSTEGVGEGAVVASVAGTGVGAMA
ncbi:hypothetical protein [Myceligenerans pegani]|uniref:Uncharacterized protein n=1 Tax=Myceligenerans pegani TaxID=2776917 RepID=A0ABR9N6E2_9MICO|nr:hypothetical protein [Myceligenerans sp. TRM 65318]MBE1878950.1 hypothetical protein [Myceligenerans sp. TRM 65318]MBE3021221.1 hypothetical protein [Myceligenerans sp. TRM 65318]